MELETRNSKLRLFIAVDLPLEVKQLLQEQQNRLRSHAPGVRWADPAGTHLTLVFLSDTPADRLEPLQRAMREAASRARPFRLSTTTLGAFPKPAQPRVLWLGVGGEREVLDRLQAAVADALEPLGYAREERPFAPHLTLGRAGRDASPAELGVLAAALRAEPPPRTIQFDVGELVLMRSERLPSGARYTVIGAEPLVEAPM